MITRTNIKAEKMELCEIKLNRKEGINEELGNEEAIIREFISIVSKKENKQELF